jgi:hypothetical protein
VLRHRTASGIVLAAFVALASLSAAGCRRGAGTTPERFLPARTAGVIVLPELRRATKELTALEDTAAAFPGAAQLPALRRSLTAQLGLDLLDPDALARAGIEPKRGLAAGVAPASGGEAAWSAPLLVLPVRDAAALQALVQRLARERLGAAVEEAPAATGVPQGSHPAPSAPRVLVYRAKGGPQALALGFGDSDRTAVLSAGPGAPEAVRAALSLEAKESLAEAPAWRGLRKALADRYAVLLAYLPPAGAGSTVPLHHPVALGVAAEPGSVRLGALAALEPATAAGLAGKGDAKALVGALAPEAPLVLRWDGDPAALGRLLAPGVPEHDRRWLADHGLDVQKDLFDLLAPGAAAAISLSPRFDLSDFSDVAVRADPLRLVSFELAAEVKDEVAAARSLARLPQLFAALQEPVGKPRPAVVDPAGRTGRIPMASGELAWRLDGKRLRLAGGPPGALDALVARKAGWTAPTQASAAALAGGLGGGILVPMRLAASVRALPEEAFGTGPYGFVVRGVVDRYLEALQAVQAISVRAEGVDAGILVETRVELPAREAKP